MGRSPTVRLEPNLHSRPSSLPDVIMTQSFKLKFLGVTILQGVEFPIFLLIFAWVLRQCSATALPPVINNFNVLTDLDVATLSSYAPSQRHLRTAK